MSNVYHILAERPALEKSDMYQELEALAEALVRSGRLRIDQDFDRVNYIRLARPYENIYKVFSRRELLDPALVPKTETILRIALGKYHSGAELEKLFRHELERMQAEISRFEPVDADTEMKLARIIVQSAHPAVIMLLLWEEVEVFLSYSYNIGDMLDINAWQSVGSSNGLQSTDGRNSAVFISCGGDPFRKNDDPDAKHGHGFPAMARMMVIAGQELGHYADIIRDAYGRKMSRHSADLGATRAKEKVRRARLKDVDTTERIGAAFHSWGLAHLVALERNLIFFAKHRRFSVLRLITFLRVRASQWRLLYRARKAGVSFIDDVVGRASHPGIHIALMLSDMRFNLEPFASAYRHTNSNVEEAIICIEALARVPQQATKWGHDATRVFMAALYAIYYGEVIPNCIASYEVLTGGEYRMQFTPHGMRPLRRIAACIRKFFPFL